MSQVKKIPDGNHSITPYLTEKNGLQAIEFYKKAFEAKELVCMMTQVGKALAHGALKIGDATFMLADEILEMENLSPATLGGSSSGNFFVCRRCGQNLQPGSF